MCMWLTIQDYAEVGVDQAEAAFRDAHSTTLAGHVHAKMLATASRNASRHGIAGQWLNGGRACYSTSLSSTIKISSIPAAHAGVISVLSLNRPRSRNALSRQLLSELGGVIEGLHAEGGKGSTRALIIASESDDAFCAGADLKERLTFTSEEYVTTIEAI